MLCWFEDRILVKCTERRQKSRCFVNEKRIGALHHPFSGSFFIPSFFTVAKKRL